MKYGILVVSTSNEANVLRYNLSGGGGGRAPGMPLIGLNAFIFVQFSAKIWPRMWIFLGSDTLISKTVFYVYFYSRLENNTPTKLFIADKTCSNNYPCLASDIAGRHDD